MEAATAVRQEQHELPQQLQFMEAAAAVRQEQHELAQQLQFPPGYHFVPLEVAAVRQRQQQELAQQLQFPPGYRFTPTEHELIMDYLRNKIEGRQPPLAVVNEIAILDWQPGSLVEAYKAYGEHKWYFFTIREPSSSNKMDEPNQKVRVPGVTATWKATGSVVPIVVPAKGKQQEGVEEPIGDEEKIVIGQYALCSIQRKQHSDAVDDAGEGTSSSKKSRRKRTKATNIDPGKTKKRRMNKKAASTQQEGMQLQQQEIAPVKAPLKLKSRARKSATRRENKALEELVQAAEGQQQKQQHQEAPPFSPVVPSLTPSQQAPPQASQEEQKSLAAYAPSVLPVVPLQGYPSLPNGMLGASAPMHHDEEDTVARSFQRDDNDYMTLLENLMSCNQDEQLASFIDDEVIADSHAELQFYQSQGYLDLSELFDQHVYTGQPQHLPGNTTLNDSSWNHGQHQGENVAFGSPGDIDSLPADDDFDYMSVLRFPLPDGNYELVLSTADGSQERYQARRAARGLFQLVPQVENSIWFRVVNPLYALPRPARAEALRRCRVRRQRRKARRGSRFVSTGEANADAE
ncbi:hypothetical protein BAE44_0021364 [Dichanthelium oligosanthes]|uniref:NAC domain-containing protein n=1 Tax=Dichanthelium oligosanthes TaxID=888268 RepID=A0A1E5UXG8_9POAL|nr:hypothetical protein BAE44_0021364 [Dichanthelium oligosanthes]